MDLLKSHELQYMTEAGNLGYIIESDAFSLSVTKGIEEGELVVHVVRSFDFNGEPVIDNSQFYRVYT